MLRCIVATPLCKDPRCAEEAQRATIKHKQKQHNTERGRKRRAAETAVEREVRLEAARERDRKRRAAETDVEREVRVAAALASSRPAPKSHVSGACQTLGSDG